MSSNLDPRKLLSMRDEVCPRTLSGPRSEQFSDLKNANLIFHVFAQHTLGSGIFKDWLAIISPLYYCGTASVCPA